MRNYPGMSDDQRQAAAEKLSYVFADTYTLYFKTHGFHWNVEGPRFFGLHNLFEQQYGELWSSIDVIAERIRALGYHPPTSYEALSRLTTIGEQDRPVPADAMIRQLIDGHEAVILTIRAALRMVQEVNDEATTGVLAARLEAHEKAAWMLGAMTAEEEPAA